MCNKYVFKTFIDNIRHVFLEEMKPDMCLRFALFALTEEVINSLNTTADLANHIGNIDKAINQYDDPQLKENQRNLFHYLRFLIHLLGSGSNTDLTQKKNDIIGYYQTLIKNFKNISWGKLDVALSPVTFCLQPIYKADFKQCISSLENMFSRSVNDVIKMDGTDAFIFCYENFTYLSFTVEKPIMLAYFTHMMDGANKLTTIKDQLALKLFPSVEEYCGVAPSSSAPRSSAPSSSTT